MRRQVAELRAVDGVSFVLNRNETLGIMGASGSGKSTLARLAAGLLQPTSGSRLATSRPQMIFQHPATSLNPRKNILSALTEALAYHGAVPDSKERRARACSVLEQVGLPLKALDCFPHEFSGGQQQRLSIARAIILNPQIIICDEAVSSLDLSVQAQILNLLEALKKQHALSYLFISHDPGVVHHFCDRVLVMDRGKIIEQK